MWWFPLMISFLVWTSESVLTTSTEISYQELEKLNATCAVDDKCTERRYPDSPLTQKCSCEVGCSEAGTCCIDSKYRGVNSVDEQLTCRTVNEEIYGYLFVDKCSSVNTSGNVFKSLCEEEWDGQDDAMLLTPVTSLNTNKTYKNYYCFRCNNEKDKFLFWNIQLTYDIDYYEDIEEKNYDVLLAYNATSRTWTVPVSQDLPVPVSLTFEVPEQVWSLPKRCIPNVISTCAESWKDEDVKNKCNSYMYLTSIRKKFGILIYKNPHCALCNFEDMNDIVCDYISNYEDPYDIPNIIPDKDYPPKSQKPFFSFTLLLDINRFDGQQTSESESCEGNSIWDPFFKKCRILQCALPRYVEKDGKCEPS